MYATNGLKMPTNYVDMSESEMEFDGGWSWSKFFAVVGIVGAAIIGCGVAGALVGAIAGSMSVVIGSGLTVCAGSVVAATGGLGLTGCALEEHYSSQ